MGRPDYIFGQFRETAPFRNAQHGGRVCCALAPQLISTALHISLPASTTYLNVSPIRHLILTYTYLTNLFHTQEMN